MEETLASYAEAADVAPESSIPGHRELLFDITAESGGADYDKAEAIKRELIDRFGEAAVRPTRTFLPEDSGKFVVKHWVDESVFDESDQITL